MSANQLKQQIASLQRRLARVSFNASPSTAASSSVPGAASKSQRRRRRRNRNTRPANSAGRFIAPATRNPNPSRVRNPRGITPSGSIRIRRKEFLGQVKGNTTGTASSYYSLSPTSFPWLKNLAKSFDRYKWHSCVIYWKPAVATTQAGIFIMGLDWDSQTTATLDMEWVAALTPVSEVPVWQMCQLVAPPSKLMTRKEYFITGDTKADQVDLTPGYLAWSVSSKLDDVVGHLWVEYDMTLFGTNKE